ncbi:hypothetical protein V502_01368 [Pseudogymnoascus sp. VKM F-4520 (FW-2644)]|nr:hypothetical protein V502_01368 [Pseudogymnoascus sp. VKM F-4520 (FW-2644)]
MAIDNSDIHHGDFEKIACIVFVSVTPAFLIARFASRSLVKQVGNDDWAALAAFTFTMACNVQTLVAIAHGWGRHKNNLNAKQLRICLILHYGFQLTYKLAVGLNKASILLLYLRIMPQRFYRFSIYGLLTIVGLFAFATVIAGIFQCIPVDRAWNKSKPGHCYNLVDAWYSNAVFSITTDFLILLLPMHMVYKLQRARREKFLFYAVFGFGFFITFTSIMRFFALKSAKNPDTTYDITSGFWSVIEINVGVIVICLPTLRTLLSRQFSFFNHSRNRTDGRPYHAHSNEPSELVTIGGSGPRGQTRKKGELDGSEEELVYVTGENSVRERDGSILKKTEFVISERGVREGDVGDQNVLKPWENHAR